MWARLDDAILDNPKIIAAGPLGFALHVAAITWCARNLTDGFIPKRRVTQLLDLGSLRVSEATPGRVRHGLSTSDVAEDLVRIGLWHDHGVSWELHDFLDYNRTRADVLAERERRRLRVARHRKRARNAVTNATVTGVPVPVPVPVPQELTLASLACAPLRSAQCALTHEFDEFWDAYPRKCDKQRARKAWAKLRPPPLRAILEALAWQRELPDWRKDDGAYVPYPATYLNGRRWEDERPPDPMAAMVARFKAEEAAQ